MRTWGATSDKHKYVFPLGSKEHRETFSDISEEDRNKFSGAKYAASQWNVHGIESVSASGHCEIHIATPLILAESSGWTATGKTFSVGGQIFRCYKRSYTTAQATAGKKLQIPHGDSWSTIVFASGGAIKADAPEPPCTIIDKATSIRSRTVNNPGIHIRPDGSFIAWQTASVTSGYVYKSTDGGENWNCISNQIRQSYNGIWEHSGVLYMFGCDANGGNIVVSVSADGGFNWSENHIIVPKTEGGFHGSSSPCVESNGRVYRAMSEKGTDTWGVVLISAPMSSDLTDPASWTVSNIVYYNTSWLPLTSTQWEEPALVKRPDGSMCIIMRIDGTVNAEYAALLEVESDRLISFSRIFSMPGSAKRLTIAYDSVSSKYWCLISPFWSNSKSQYGLSPVQARNSMCLISSQNLIDWTLERTCIYSDNPYNNSYHYIDWRFDGDDLVSTFRCSVDEERGLAYSYHDSNGLGYFRVKNFRNGSAVAPILVDTPVTAGLPTVPSL